MAACQSQVARHCGVAVAVEVLEAARQAQVDQALTVAAEVLATQQRLEVFQVEVAAAISLQPPAQAALATAS